MYIICNKRMQIFIKNTYGYKYIHMCVYQYDWNVETKTLTYFNIVHIYIYI